MEKGSKKGSERVEGCMKIKWGRDKLGKKIKRKSIELRERRGGVEWGWEKGDKLN